MMNRGLCSRQVLKVPVMLGWLLEAQRASLLPAGLHRGLCRCLVLYAATYIAAVV